jgi:prepilin-type N-terminal cleavage/methylation domain-containing protein
MKKLRIPGFTLIELLVVISIIAILMAIMMPALNKVRRQAKITICGNNLKQISVGLNLYASDHGQYPERKVGFPRLAARKVSGSVPEPDLRKMVVDYIANGAYGMLHCPAIRSKKPETQPGIIEDAVYSSQLADDDYSKWLKYFTQPSHKCVDSL